MKESRKWKKWAVTALAVSWMMGLVSCGAPAAPQEEPKDLEEEVYRVGIVKFVDHASLDQIQESIQSRLNQRGEELGVTFQYRGYTYNGQGDASALQQIATQLVSQKVDVVVPIATPAAQVVQAVFEETETPIVFAAVSDPVTAKLVESLDKPGGKITGVSDALNTRQMMDLMLALDPEIQKVGLLYSKSEDSSALSIQEAKAYLEEKDISYVEKTGTNTDEIMTAADALVAAGVEAIFTPTDNTVMRAELAIFDTLQEAGIPHYAGADSFALNGAFLGYGVDYHRLGQAVADQVVSILKENRDPGELPVTVVEGKRVLVNSQVCEGLGLKMEKIREIYQTMDIEVEEISTSQSFPSSS